MALFNFIRALWVNKLWEYTLPTTTYGWTRWLMYSTIPTNHLSLLGLWSIFVLENSLQVYITIHFKSPLKKGHGQTQIFQQHFYQTVIEVTIPFREFGHDHF